MIQSLSLHRRLIAGSSAARTAAGRIRHPAAPSLACAAIGLCGVPAARAHAGADSIPRIARLAGATVGRDTIEAMQTRLGAGAFIPGQHPIGGRSWSLRKQGLIVTADGFSYNSRGRIVDTLGLSLDGRNPVRPAPSSWRLAFLGTILPGMSRKDVMARLKGRLPPPAVLRDTFWNGKGQQEFGWRMAGRTGRSAFGRARFTEWTTRLLFERDRLIEINIDCD